MSDKSNQLKVAEELRFVESLKTQWLAMIDAMVDPIMIVDKDYVITKANKAMANIAEKDVRSIIGKKCFKAFTGKDSPCSGCKMTDDRGKSDSLSWDLARVRGNKFYEVTSQPLRTNEGELEGMVQVYRDRTEAKKLGRQLLQSEKLASIGLLAGGIAHEINNPLGGILIFSQVLLREMKPDEIHYQDVEEIHNAAQRCKAIVENLLDFARQKSEEEEAKVEAVAIEDVVDTALRFASVGSPFNDVEVFKKIDPELAPVLADRNKLIQVFLNLIQNAFHAMPEGGDLSIEATEMQSNASDTRMIQISVRDTGTGISSMDQKKVFDPFFTTKEPGEGTGLGLSICHSIIEDFDGSIFFESTPKKGTAFNVLLPAAAEEVSRIKPSA